MSTSSDINEHLVTLFELAKECSTITEFGTRDGCSTTALAAAVENTDKRLTCIDLYRSNGIDVFLKLKNISFQQADTLIIDIEETDFLFIDTLHTYFQLFSELKKHSKSVLRYIALHDTVSYGLVDEWCYDPKATVKMSKLTQQTQKTGLQAAVNDFLHTEDGVNWKTKNNYLNNNGLLVLERIK